MARRTFSTRAIVLGHTKLGEQDLILTLLALDGTQQRAVAKGARRPGGRFAARCELFCEADLLVAEGRTLGTVCEAGTVNAHAALRGDLDRTSTAACVAEVARLTCYEGAEDRFLYPIASRALAACEEAADHDHLDLVLAAYTLKVLGHGGWYPVLDVCPGCGSELALGGERGGDVPAADEVWFSATAGGVVCGDCARELRDARRIDGVTVAWLRSLLECTFDQLVGAPVDHVMAVRLVSLAHVWASTHLDARLRTWEFRESMSI